MISMGDNDNTTGRGQSGFYRSSAPREDDYVYTFFDKYFFVKICSRPADTLQQITSNICMEEEEKLQDNEQMYQYYMWIKVDQK